MKMSPTVGRVIYIRVQNVNTDLSTQPFAGLITRVNEDGTINAAGWNDTGNPIVANNVQLLNPHEDIAPDFGTYTHWMEYQVTAAKKDAQNQENKAAAEEEKAAPVVPVKGVK